jgi:hypothetical protein
VEREDENEKRDVGVTARDGILNPVFNLRITDP